MKNIKAIHKTFDHSNHLLFPIPPTEYQALKEECTNLRKRIQAIEAEMKMWAILMLFFFFLKIFFFSTIWCFLLLWQVAGWVWWYGYGLLLLSYCLTILITLTLFLFSSYHILSSVHLLSRPVRRPLCLASTRYIHLLFEQHWDDHYI